MGHGTSLMAPSNRRNAMTSPLRIRPVQRAGFEMSFAAVSEKIVMVGSVRDCWRSTQGRTAKMEFDNDAKFFVGWAKAHLCRAHHASPRIAGNVGHASLCPP